MDVNVHCFEIRCKRCSDLCSEVCALLHYTCTIKPVKYKTSSSLCSVHPVRLPPISLPSCWLSVMEVPCRAVFTAVSAPLCWNVTEHSARRAAQYSPVSKEIRVSPVGDVAPGSRGWVDLWPAAFPHWHQEPRHRVFVWNISALCFISYGKYHRENKAGQVLSYHRVKRQDWTLAAFLPLWSFAAYIVNWSNYCHFKL